MVALTQKDHEIASKCRNILVYLPGNQWFRRKLTTEIIKVCLDIWFVMILTLWLVKLFILGCDI